MPELKKTTIGGQALIEGLLMLGPDTEAIAMRHPDGHILVETKPRAVFGKLGTIPFVRGSVRLVTQLKTGITALTRSAELQEEGDATVETKEPSKVDHFFAKHSGLVTGVAVATGLLFSVALFILLPSLLSDLLRSVFQIPTGTRNIGLALAEGAIRLAIFVGYLFVTSRLKEIQRVWMYHGAEHKTIACYEHGSELKVDEVRRFSRLHPRCGTSFMFLVMMLSILVFAVIPRQTALLNAGVRILLLPVVAGLAFELIRLAGKYDNAVTRAISKPGLLLQNLTTAEPDDAILEVAIAAMEAALPATEGSDDWT